LVREQPGRGCIGYTCAELGIPRFKDEQGKDKFFADGPPNLSAKVCFKTLDLAIAEQRRWNAAKKCKGNACTGKPATARVVDIQFANVDQGGLVFDPQPTTKGGDTYNLVKNPGLPKNVRFWELVNNGATGNLFQGNFDVAILMEDGRWMHADSKRDKEPKYSTTEKMTEQFDLTSGFDNPGEVADPKDFKYWFNTRFWCVVCETPWK